MHMTRVQHLARIRREIESRTYAAEHDASALEHVATCVEEAMQPNDKCRMMALIRWCRGGGVERRWFWPSEFDKAAIMYESLCDGRRSIAVDLIQLAPGWCITRSWNTSLAKAQPESE